MYRVSPLTYLVSGIASVGMAKKSIKCATSETIMVPISSHQGHGVGTTCSEYLSPYIGQAGGYVTNPEASQALCQFCPAQDTDTVLQSLGIRYVDKWRNFGFMCIFILFNVLGALFLYWISRTSRGHKHRGRG
jgi:ABC-type multidrug transport system permease subunit